MEDLLAHAATGFLATDGDGEVTEATAPAAALLGAADGDPEALLGQPLAAALPGTVADEVSAGLAQTGRVDVEQYLPTAERWLAVHATAIDGRTLLEVRDVTERVRRRIDLEGRSEDLELLSRLVTMVSEVLGALVTAGTHEQIRETVVETLAATELFELAWIADWNADRDGLTVRAAAGEDGDLLAAASTADGPERRALETGETAVIDSLPDAVAVPETVRRAAFARGVQAAAAVPLAYGETVFGVLGLYTARPAVLADPARSGIETLGAVVGFAEHAAAQRGTVHAATRRELELALDPGAGPVATLAATVPATIVLESTAAVDPETLLAYVSVSDAPAAAVVDAAATVDGVTNARTVEAGEDGGLVELRLGPGSPLVRLVDRGGTVREARLDADGGTVRVDVSPDADVRALLDRLAAETPGIDLAATRTRERTGPSVASVEQVLDGDLTERQRTALQTAYAGGYFRSPRQSTAAELAESLSISAPTFSHHLRAAQRKLLRACFED